MEPTTSNQAVEADTTAQPAPVKRLKRGDVREDGKIFWCYDSNCASGEWWVTSEEFAAKKVTERAKRADRKANLSAKRAALPTKFRRGDTREDGMIFWCYDSGCTNGEWWMTPEQFAAKKAKEAKKNANLSAKRAASPTKLRRGDTRDDGMVFWGYHPNCLNGEHWLTPEEFATKKAKEAKKRAALSAKKAALPTKLRRGDLREDGMVFWEYSPSYVNSERWLTPEQFATEKTKKNERTRERRATDPLSALKCRLSSRNYAFLRGRGFKKNIKTALTLGCTYEDFKAHIESEFLPLGMTWETFLSDGHIDHIVPLDAADTEEDVYALNHYTNLRPMWGPDNITKSDTLPEEHELPDNLHPKVKEIWLTAKNASTR